MDNKELELLLKKAIEEQKKEPKETLDKIMNTGLEENLNFEWDAELPNIKNQAKLLLPPGEYEFTVTELVRGTFPGSDKIPPCNKASLILEIDTKDGAAYVKTDLLLTQKLLWKLQSFFRSIGEIDPESNAPYKMNWSAVEGATGRAVIQTRKYIKGDGEEVEYNDVKQFLDKY